MTLDQRKETHKDVEPDEIRDVAPGENNTIGQVVTFIRHERASLEKIFPRAAPLFAIVTDHIATTSADITWRTTHDDRHVAYPVTDQLSNIQNIHKTRALKLGHWIGKWVIQQGQDLHTGKPDPFVAWVKSFIRTGKEDRRDRITTEWGVHGYEAKIDKNMSAGLAFQRSVAQGVLEAAAAIYPFKNQTEIGEDPAFRPLPHVDASLQPGWNIVQNRYYQQTRLGSVFLMSRQLNGIPIFSNDFSEQAHAKLAGITKARTLGIHSRAPHLVYDHVDVVIRPINMNHTDWTIRIYAPQGYTQKTFREFEELSPEEAEQLILGTAPDVVWQSYATLPPRHADDSVLSVSAFDLNSVELSDVQQTESDAQQLDAIESGRSIIHINIHDRVMTTLFNHGSMDGKASMPVSMSLGHAVGAHQRPNVSDFQPELRVHHSVRHAAESTRPDDETLEELFKLSETTGTPDALIAEPSFRQAVDHLGLSNLEYRFTLSGEAQKSLKSLATALDTAYAKPLRDRVADVIRLSHVPLDETQQKELNKLLSIVITPAKALSILSRIYYGPTAMCANSYMTSRGVQVTLVPKIDLSKPLPDQLKDGIESLAVEYALAEIGATTVGIMREITDGFREFTNQTGKVVDKELSNAVAFINQMSNIGQGTDRPKGVSAEHAQDAVYLTNFRSALEDEEFMAFATAVMDVVAVDEQQAETTLTTIDTRIHLTALEAASLPIPTSDDIQRYVTLLVKESPTRMAKDLLRQRNRAATRMQTVIERFETFKKLKNKSSIGLRLLQRMMPDVFDDVPETMAHVLLTTLHNNADPAYTQTLFPGLRELMTVALLKHVDGFGVTIPGVADQLTTAAQSSL